MSVLFQTSSKLQITHYRSGNFDFNFHNSPERVRNLFYISLVCFVFFCSHVYHYCIYLYQFIGYLIIVLFHLYIYKQGPFIYSLLMYLVYLLTGMPRHISIINLLQDYFLISLLVFLIAFVSYICISTSLYLSVSFC